MHFPRYVFAVGAFLVVFHFSSFASSWKKRHDGKGCAFNDDCDNTRCSGNSEEHHCCGTFICPQTHSYDFKEDGEDFICNDGDCDQQGAATVWKVTHSTLLTVSAATDTGADMRISSANAVVTTINADMFKVPIDVCLEDTLGITLPYIPLSLQFGLLIDLSGSYVDDLDKIKTLGPSLVNDLLVTDAGTERDLRLALGTFIDIPEYPFGISTDYDYREEKDFGDGSENDRNDWLTSLQNLTTGDGYDSPESQSIALQTAIDTWAWADGFNKFLAITTDDSFHTPDEDPRYVAVQDIIDAANAKNIKIIALKAGSAGTEMDELAAGTSGSVQTTETDSSDIVAAIFQGVANSTYDVVEVVSECDEPWVIDADAAVMNVSSGSTLSFDVTVCALDNTESMCGVEVVADTGVVEGFNYIVVDGNVTRDSS